MRTLPLAPNTAKNQGSKKRCPMQNNWFLRMLGAVDDALDLLLTGAVLLLLAMFIASITDTRGCEIVMNTLSRFSHG